MEFLSGTAAKPRPEQHPLLAAMEEGDVEGQHRERDTDLEQVVLAHRMDELRWSEPRRGSWAGAPPAKRPPEGGALLRAAAASQVRVSSVTRKGGKAGLGGHTLTDGWQQLIRLMDPGCCGFVSPDSIIPLMFWLGLTRSRSAALVILELAFGPGNIPTDAIRELSPYLDVQVRLVEGLMKLAKRASLEHLCEFLTESDLLNVRTWFSSMKRSPDGHVDTVEVQNLFAREGVTSDRQALFRFLRHVARSEVLPKLAAGEEFGSIIARCAVAWCLHRTIVVVTDPAAAPAGDEAEAAASLAGGSGDGDISLRWTELQRKIMVSLLINHRFWGRDSRTVLSSWEPPRTTTIGDELSPEQWQGLFQRVRAQGMAAVLPVGEEADDPNFLRGKTKHTEVPAVAAHGRAHTALLR